MFVACMLHVCCTHVVRVLQHCNVNLHVKQQWDAELYDSAVPSTPPQLLHPQKHAPATRPISALYRLYVGMVDDV